MLRLKKKDCNKKKKETTRKHLVSKFLGFKSLKHFKFKFVIFTSLKSKKTWYRIQNFRSKKFVWYNKILSNNTFFRKIKTISKSMGFKKNVFPLFMKEEQKNFLIFFRLMKLRLLSSYSLWKFFFEKKKILLNVLKEGKIDISLKSRLWFFFFLYIKYYNFMLLAKKNGLIKKNIFKFFYKLLKSLLWKKEIGSDKLQDVQQHDFLLLKNLFLKTSNSIQNNNFHHQNSLNFSIFNVIRFFLNKKAHLKIHYLFFYKKILYLFSKNLNVVRQFLCNFTFNKTHLTNYLKNLCYSIWYSRFLSWKKRNNFFAQEKYRIVFLNENYCGILLGLFKKNILYNGLKLGNNMSSIYKNWNLFAKAFFQAKTNIFLYKQAYIVHKFNFFLSFLRTLKIKGFFLKKNLSLKNKNLVNALFIRQFLIKKNYKNNLSISKLIYLIRFFLWKYNNFSFKENFLFSKKKRKFFLLKKNWIKCLNKKTNLLYFFLKFKNYLSNNKVQRNNSVLNLLLFFLKKNNLKNKNWILKRHFDKFILNDLLKSNFKKNVSLKKRTYGMKKILWEFLFYNKRYSRNIFKKYFFFKKHINTFFQKKYINKLRTKRKFIIKKPLFNTIYIHKKNKNISKNIIKKRLKRSKRLQNHKKIKLTNTKLVKKGFFFNFNNIKNILASLYGQKISLFFINALTLSRFERNLHGYDIEQAKKWTPYGSNSRKVLLKYDMILINKYKYTATYIKDLIRVTFIAMFFKKASFLANFITFQIAKLPRNRKETKLLRFIVKVLKKFAGARREIYGLRFKLKGRINKWRRSKSFIKYNGQLPLQTIKSRIEFGSAKGLTRKGALSISIWIAYNPIFWQYFENAFNEYFYYSYYKRHKNLKKYYYYFTSKN